MNPPGTPDESSTKKLKKIGKPHSGTFSNRSVGKQFKRVNEKIHCWSEYDTELLTLGNIAETTTTKEVAVKIRGGQQQFRNQLLKKLKPICPITKIDNPEMLKAGHIKPWQCLTAEKNLTS